MAERSKRADAGPGRLRAHTRRRKVRWPRRSGAPSSREGVDPGAGAGSARTGAPFPPRRDIETEPRARAARLRPRGPTALLQRQRYAYGQELAERRIREGTRLVIDLTPAWRTAT